MALVFGPFYFDMNSNIESIYCIDFVQLGKRNINMQFHAANQLIADNTDHAHAILNEFLKISISSVPLIDSVNIYQPILI